MASAWKNVVPRREHRERPQPEARQHLGLLEKHKDYVKRARAHHRKRDRIVALKRRAELRNKDEFYHGMASAKTKVRWACLGRLARAAARCASRAAQLTPSRSSLPSSPAAPRRPCGVTQVVPGACQPPFPPRPAPPRPTSQDGVHVKQRPSQQPPVSVLKLLKTQDVAYVGLKAQAERSKIERLRATLHRTASGGQGKHMLFMDDPRGEARSEAEDLGRAGRSDDEDSLGSDAGYDAADGSAAGSLSAALAAAGEEGDGPARAAGQAGSPGVGVRARKRQREADAGDGGAESGDDEADEEEGEEDGAGSPGAAAGGQLTAVDAADALAAAVAAANASAHDGLRQVSAKRLATEQGAVPAAQLLAAAAAEGPKKRSKRSLRRAAKRAAKGSAEAYEELREREARAAVLSTAAAHFEYQKHLLSKGRRVKVADATPNRPALFKWKRERKH